MQLQKGFKSFVSGLARALRENDDAPDDDDDYGSHSGPRESGGRWAESPLPPSLTHTSPTRFWQELKLRQNRLLQTTSDYYLPPWITTYPLGFPDLPMVLMMTWEAAQA